MLYEIAQTVNAPNISPKIPKNLKIPFVKIIPNIPRTQAIISIKNPATKISLPQNKRNIVVADSERDVIPSQQCLLPLCSVPLILCSTFF